MKHEWHLFAAAINPILSDLSRWIWDPKFSNSFTVEMAVFLHFIKVFLTRKKSSKDLLFWCSYSRNVENIGFKIFAKIVGSVDKP